MPSLPFQSTYSPPLASIAFSNGPDWSVAFTYDDTTKLVTLSARGEITSPFLTYEGSVTVLHTWHHDVQLKFDTVSGDAGSLAYTMTRGATQVDHTMTIAGVLAHTQWNQGTDAVTSFARNEAVFTWPQFSRFIRFLRDFISETQYARV